MSQSGIQTTYTGKPGRVERRWWLVDAQGQVLGRLAARLARILQGKHRPHYTPNIDLGDFVVVVNARKIGVTGTKLDSKEYQFFSGYPDGQKRRTLRQMLDRAPEEVIRLAVRRMLPKSRLGRKMLLKLKLHREELPKHGYKAQKIAPLPAGMGASQARAVAGATA